MVSFGKNVINLPKILFLTIIYTVNYKRRGLLRLSNLNDGVGKKIVEALKKQTEIESGVATEEQTVVEEPVNVETEPVENLSDSGLLSSAIDNVEEPIESSSLDDMFVDKMAELKEDNDIMSDFMSTEEKVPEAAEMPGNIIILKKLITQLPSGVTRHTGAQIIRQTMEALGISMKSVLSEAQDVQASLKESAKECQMSIQEYKRKISMLEKQTQSYQKQYAALNDLISLFIQTTK